jgi:hypothetical protein
MSLATQSVVMLSAQVDNLKSIVESLDIQRSTIFAGPANFDGLSF